MSGLICLGREVELDLREPPIGRSGASKTVVPPADAGMLFDASGTFWPKCSLLIADFTRGTEEVDAAKDYFGRGAAVFEGEVELPPKELSAWQRLGEVATVFYDRAGTKAPGFFRHKFNAPRGLFKLIFLIKGKAAKQPPVLYTLFQRRTGRTFYRIELPEKCIVDSRGLVVP